MMDVVEHEWELEAFDHATGSVLRRSSSNVLSSSGSRRSLKARLERAVSAAEDLSLYPLARSLERKRQTLESMPSLDFGRCRLLELPAEIREQIWAFAVTEWSTTLTANNDGGSLTRRSLQKMPIRMDRFNRPLPPAITRVCLQTRHETLHLYYSENIFECWRPLYWIHDWSQSTFVDWLTALGPLKMAWLNDVVLLYKHEGELEHDIEDPLAELGFELKPGVLRSRQELSEYEMCFESLGLPRQFGTKKRTDRWLAGNANNA